MLQLSYKYRPARGYVGLLSEGTKIESQRTYINFNGGAFARSTFDFSGSTAVATGTPIRIVFNSQVGGVPPFTANFLSTGVVADDIDKLIGLLQSSYLSSSVRFLNLTGGIFQADKTLMGSNPTVSVTYPADYVVVETIDLQGEEPDCNNIPFGTVVHQGAEPLSPQPFNNYYSSPSKDYRLVKPPEAEHTPGGEEVFVGITTRCYHHTSQSNEVDYKYPQFSNCGEKGVSKYAPHDQMKILEEGALWVCPVVLPRALTDIPIYRIAAPNGEQLGEISSYPVGGALPADFAEFPCDARFLETHADDNLAILHIDQVNVGSV